MSGPKGLDDLFQLGLHPRVRQYRATPPELGMRRTPHAVSAAGRVDRGSDLATARGKTQAAITRMIRDARIQRGKALLVRSAQGAGKSTAVALALQQHRLNARILVGTRTLAQEQAATYHHYRLIEGRNPHNCQRYEVVESLGARGHPIERLACVADGEPLCPFFQSCAYYRQFAQPGTWIAAAEQLYNPRFVRGGEFVVVDDAELPRAMVEEHHVDLETLTHSAEQLRGKSRGLHHRTSGRG